MVNHPAFTNEARELFSDLAAIVYSLEQVFHDYPEGSQATILAKEFVDAWHKLYEYISTE